MNDIQLHLMVNHLPIMGVLFGTFIFLLALARRNKTLHYTGAGLMVFAAVSGIVANNSGEGAEHILEEAIPEISHSLIHEHEEAAELYFLLLLVLGGLAILHIILTSKGKSLGRISGALLFIASLSLTAMGFNVGKTGGEIRHLEEMQFEESEHSDHHEEGNHSEESH